MELSLVDAWLATTRRVAVLAGAGAALLSLLGDVPVGTSVLRGAGGYVAVLLVGRAGAVALRALHRPTGSAVPAHLRDDGRGPAPRA